MTDIVIAAATRTAIGSFSGSLAGLSGQALGSIVIKAALERAKVDAADVSEVIMGHILTAGQGMNTARQAALNAGLPIGSSAMTINQVCGSGLRAVALGMQAILAGDSTVVVAGGQESMSNSQHAGYLRSGVKMGPMGFVDTMINDGLTDVFNSYHMGITAENVAKENGITREMQDEFAVASQNKAEAAIKAGRFKDEITPVTITVKKEEKLFDTDEFVRMGATLDSLAKLRPAFAKDGTVTAGNASGINDGAAALVLMTAAEAAKRGITPLARIAGWATAGVDPKIMGIGPVPASQKALARAGWKHADLDLIEANEAFAAQALAVNKQMGWDTSKVNVNGGAIALGHPIGASGARVLVSLIHEMAKRGGKKGLATLCIGGGMGIALCIER
ncbi:Acetyl-CoA acetyltransferase [Paramagnetospirillum caucaseum]|uniref:Acetyl-CoA acetyltransferase n=1 Tax=Paramagnetospirillum caucaseum TaxID=1244869 RepID=M2Z045_9PROT|nr:acetyl-CoA C-acetyltransferase [Paramagnetospirillum caucaseum]EME67630.1 Acetyl-CoA acetyltransferase [Paramagnetospirillum caucaseum]